MGLVKLQYVTSSRGMLIKKLAHLHKCKNMANHRLYMAKPIGTGFKGYNNQSPERVLSVWKDLIDKHG